jgi:hypothetical protein
MSQGLHQPRAGRKKACIIMATSTANFARFAAAVRRKETPRRIRRNCHGEALLQPET